MSNCMYCIRTKLDTNTVTTEMTSKTRNNVLTILFNFPITTCDFLDSKPLSSKNFSILPNSPSFDEIITLVILLSFPLLYFSFANFINDSGTNKEGISFVKPTILATTKSFFESLEIRNLNLISLAKSSDTCGIPLALMNVFNITKKSRGITIGTIVSPSFHFHLSMGTSKNFEFTVCKNTSELNFGT